MTEFKDRLISKLSGGQAQRVSIARALIGSPDLIILDEPSTGIDRKSQEGIYALLRTLNQEHHITIISVEHNLEMALANSTISITLQMVKVISVPLNNMLAKSCITRGCNSVDHENCSCFTDVTAQAHDTTSKEVRHV